MKIDLIIPSYKPEKNFLELLDRMVSQTVPINKIIIINAEQKFYDRLVYSSRFIDSHKNIEVHHISRLENDCGKSRNMGVKLSDADYVLMMKQDVITDDPELVAKLLKAIEADRDIAVSYARVAPGDSASEAEKFARQFYFGDKSEVRSLKDVEKYGWSAYMNSNYCALYKRKIFDELGGFLNHVIANEDILFASKAINEGYKVCYVADAVVVDTKVYTDKDHMKISFDKAVSMLKHPETFDISNLKDEIKKLDRMTVSYLKSNGFKHELVEFRRLSRAKRKGFAKGLKYKKIANMDLPKYSNNPEYWRKDEILRDRSAIDVHAGYGRSNAEVEMLSTPPVNARKLGETED